MPQVRVHVPVAPGWAELRVELGVREAFPEAVVTAAQSAATSPRLPTLDQRALPFLTIDPVGSLDLDQAMHLETAADGYTVYYAIADVAAFVDPGGELDTECHLRGETYYCPDIRVPLHPPVLGEGAASLLPGQDRPAVVWTLHLDHTGELRGTEVRRAMVRSRQRLDYATVQGQLDSGTAPPELQLLATIGRLLQARAAARGALDLPTPEQVVDVGPDGRPVLRFRAPVPCEAFNAQISLLTGRAAASLMLQEGVGLLRTLPPPETGAVSTLRRSALALGVEWPAGRTAGQILSALDATDPKAAAVLALAPRLLRGAAYSAFDGAPPAQPLHSAVAAPYAHCTAPLRRLADRYVSEVCLALAEGSAVPAWARQALPALPAEMAAADHRAHQVERAVVDLAEALVLAPCVGERFDAVVVEANPTGGMVQLHEPAVRARCVGQGLVAGTQARVQLVEADPATRAVTFQAV